MGETCHMRTQHIGEASSGKRKTNQKMSSVNSLSDYLISLISLEYPSIGQKEIGKKMREISNNEANNRPKGCYQWEKKRVYLLESASGNPFRH